MWNPGRIVSRVLCVAMGVVFLAACAGKLAGPGGFIASIALVGGVTYPTAQMLAAGILGVEAAIGVLMITCAARRVTFMVSLGLLAVFSLALLFFEREGVRTCGCLGVLDSLIGSAQSPIVALGRNLGMGLVLVWLAWVAPQPWPNKRAAPAVAAVEASRGTRAFSLVELVVVVLVVAVLLGLTLPMVRQVRASATDSRSVSTQRDLLGAVHAYAIDFRDCVPFSMTAGDPEGPRRVLGQRVDFSYFGCGKIFWINLLTDGYLSSDAPYLGTMTRDELGASNVELGVPQGALRSPFAMTFTAFASPRWWREDETPATVHELGPQRLSDAHFPDRKVLIWDVNGGDQRLGTQASDLPPGKALLWAFACIDGSARGARVSPDGADVVSRPYGANRFVFMTTRNGFHGRDLDR